MQGHRKDPEAAEPDGNSEALVPAVPPPRGFGPLVWTTSRGAAALQNAAFMQRALGTGISGAGAPSSIYQHPGKEGLLPRHLNQSTASLTPHTFTSSLPVFPPWEHWRAAPAPPRRGHGEHG